MAKNDDYYALCEGKGCGIRNLCKRYTQSQSDKTEFPYCDPETRYMYESKNK
jgi:hypothetical protein